MRVQMILEAIDRASRPIRAVMNSLIGVERSAQAASGVARIGQGLTQVGARVGAMAAISSGAAIGLATSMLDTASAFEKMETTLITTEGSQEKARKAMSWVSDFATKTPYELQQVNEAFVRLRAYGLDPTNGTLKTLGDASAGMGVPLMTAVEAMADAVTGENERLKTFGITTSVNTAAKQVSYTYADLAGVMHTVTAKMGDQADIANKLSGIFNSRFAGSMERLSSTWESTVNNLRDAWTRFQLAIMEAGLFDWMRSKAQELLTTVNAMAADGRLAALATDIGNKIKAVLVFTYAMAVGIAGAVQTITPYIAAFVDSVGGAKNAMLILGGMTILGPILRIASGIAMIVRAFIPLGPILMIAARSFMMLGAAMMTTPVGWIIAAIAIIAGGAYLIYENWAMIGPWLAGLWATVKNGMATAWNGMIAWLSGVGPRMLVSVKSGWTALTGWVSGIGSAISQKLSAGWASVTAWFAGASWPQFPAFLSLDAITATLAGLGTSITGKLSTAWASITSWFGSISWPQFPDFPALDKITTMLSGLGTDIRGKLDAAWASITAWFSTVKLPAFTLLADIQAMLDPIINWIEDWGTRFLGVFETAFNKVSAFIGTAAGKIGDAFGKVTSALSSATEFVFGPSATSVAADAASIEKVSAAAQSARSMINMISPAATAAVASAQSVLSGVSFYSHGVAMMTTLATGIKAGASAAVAAARSTVQQIRDYLPHSPAKVGPLSDLDRVQFSQTLATAISAGAPKALTAVRALSAGMAAAMMSVPAHAVALPNMPAFQTMAGQTQGAGMGGMPTAPAAVQFARADQVSTSKSVSGGSAVTVNLTLSPTLNGTGGGDFIDQLKSALPKISYELAQAIKSEIDRTDRTRH